MKKLTPFKIGLSLIVLGSICTALVFSTTEKTSHDLNLGIRESTNLSLDLKGKGIGFYKITIPNYSKELVLVKILDSQGNTVDLKRIETKMSVNYFEFQHGGKYTLEIINFAENSIQVNVEFGNTNEAEITFPVVIAFIGGFFLVWSGYNKLRNYSTAHPEENRP